MSKSTAVGFLKRQNRIHEVDISSISALSSLPSILRSLWNRVFGDRWWFGGKEKKRANHIWLRCTLDTVISPSCPRKTQIKNRNRKNSCMSKLDMTRLIIKQSYLNVPVNSFLVLLELLGFALRGSIFTQVDVFHKFAAGKAGILTELGHDSTSKLCNRFLSFFSWKKI